MDEIGRGTSTFDGLALAGAIAAQLHDRNRAFTLFATHYFELTEFPKKHERALNVHVSAAESGDDIVFLHEIEAGPASRSYGVQVARLAACRPAWCARHARRSSGLEAERQRVASSQIDLFARTRPRKRRHGLQRGRGSWRIPRSTRRSRCSTPRCSRREKRSTRWHLAEGPSRDPP